MMAGRARAAIEREFCASTQRVTTGMIIAPSHRV